MTGNRLTAAASATTASKPLKPGEQRVIVLPPEKSPGVTVVINRTTRDYAYDYADALNEVRTSGAHKWVVNGNGEVCLVTVNDHKPGPVWEPSEAQLRATHAICGRYARSGISVEQFNDLNRRGQIAREVEQSLRQLAHEPA